MYNRFPHYHQLDQMDCGPTCLRIIAKHFGKNYSLQYLRDKTHESREGVSLLDISDTAEELGFHTLAAQLPFDKFAEEAPLPCIAHWNQNHFVVVYKIRKGTVYVSDPASGLIKYSGEEFKNSWITTQNKGRDNGTVLFLEPTPEFYEDEEDKGSDKTSLKFYLGYLYKYKKYIFQLFLGLLLGSLLQLIFPFLTQAIVDVGIQNQNISFIYLILAAQLMLFISQTSVNFIRSWILLHLSTRINISIISDFLAKLMKLPIGFFESKMIGDLLQRITDHRRVEQFLTSSTLNTVFSMFNFVIFGVVLLYYNVTIFFIFLIGSILYVGWILLFLRKRKEIDYKRFSQQSRNQSSLVQLITGMQEIKLNNSEKQKRWEWERIQARLFKVGIDGLKLRQYQTSGSSFLNEGKNILISFFAAKAVIDGTMTLGMMLAVQYIIGQLNAPINQLIGFIQSSQDAKISLERLGEIHNKADEEDAEEHRMDVFPENQTIEIENLSFRYGGPRSDLVLKDLNLTIPEGKVTAIVGVSGSGKTTLIKLLLKFYELTKGKIRVGGFDLSNIKNRSWRENCGVVMQDGYIFSDTIAENIAVSDEHIDNHRLLEAIRMARLESFIESRPLGFNTRIGQNGNVLSGGEKQRILIARAVYKNPEYLFFDEATSSLDAENEKMIAENLNDFFINKTVVMVAHRLSTVKNADQIAVLDAGEIIEVGDHNELIAREGAYFNLIKNQLELGA